jgi:hypothetical protein
MPLPEARLSILSLSRARSRARPYRLEPARAPHALARGLVPPPLPRRISYRQDARTAVANDAAPPSGAAAGSARASDASRAREVLREGVARHGKEDEGCRAVAGAETESAPNGEADCSR